MNPAKFLKKHRILSQSLFLAYMALIFLASSVPAKSLGGGLSSQAPILHFFEYSILGFLAYPVLGSRYPAFYSVLFASLYGVSDEVHQLFVPGREFDVLDIFYDFIGSLFGVYLSRWWIRR